MHRKPLQLPGFRKHYRLPGESHGASRSCAQSAMTSPLLVHHPSNQSQVPLHQSRGGDHILGLLLPPPLPPPSASQCLVTKLLCSLPPARKENIRHCIVLHRHCFLLDTESYCTMGSIRCSAQMTHVKESTQENTKWQQTMDTFRLLISLMCSCSKALSALPGGAM